MRSVNFKKSNKKKSAWALATLLMKKYLESGTKINDLFDSFSSSIEPMQLNRSKFLFYGAIRNTLRIKSALNSLIKKKPKNLVLALFLISGYELLNHSGHKKEKIIHNAVEEAKSLLSENEVKFINAVLRKLTEALENQSPKKSLSEFYSHPKWLVDHWIKQFGKKHTEELLSWNQSIPRLYLYSKKLPEALVFKVNNIEPSLYELPEKSLQDIAIKELLNQGHGYIKDPATLNSVNFLDPKPYETILDLCAAPGGKTFDCIQRMDNKGTIVAIDLPNKRINRLKENLHSFQSKNPELCIFPHDILTIEDRTFAEAKLPNKYDGILLDAPCSNTGVIQRKPDIRYRLSKEDIDQCAKLQLKLLTKASQWVEDQGRIVYSTCSIDYKENDAVVNDFLNSPQGGQFTLAKKKNYYPWEHKFDGAGVFLILKSKA